MLLIITHQDVPAPMSSEVGKCTGTKQSSSRSKGATRTAKRRCADTNIPQPAHGHTGKARKGSYKTDLKPHCPECSRFTAPHLIYLAVAWDVACTQVFHLSKRRFLSSDTGGTGQSQRTRVHPRCSVCIRSLQSDSKPNFYVDVRLSATDR